MDDYTQDVLNRLFGEPEHDIEIVQDGGLAHWKCSCGAPKYVSWVLGASEAMKRGNQHLDICKPGYHVAKRLK